MAFLLSYSWSRAEDGYRLWLRYDFITEVEKLKEYKAALTEINMTGNSQALNAARSAWCASRYKQSAEEEDPCNHLAFRNAEPLGEQFESLAQAILEPLLKYRRKEA